MLHTAFLLPEGHLFVLRGFELITAVTFFFLLSGFVLAYSYAGKVDACDPGQLRDFYAARIARIFPLHWLAFLAILPTAAEGMAVWTGRPVAARWHALANVSLMQGYSPSPRVRDGFNSPAWSLSVEWTMYLCFPFLIAGFLSKSPYRRGLAGLLASGGFLYAWSRLLQTRWAEEEIGLMVNFPPVRLFDFAVGILLGLAFRRRALTDGERGKPTIRWTAYEILALASLAASLLPFRGMSLESRVVLSWCGYYLPAFSLILWVFAHERGWLSHCLCWRPLIALGEASFAMYMLHCVPIGWIRHYKPTLDIANGYVPWISFLAGVTLISLATHRWFERPARDRMRRFLSRRTKPSAELTAIVSRAA